MIRIKVWFRIMRWCIGTRKMSSFDGRENEDVEITDFDHRPYIAWMDNYGN